MAKRTKRKPAAEGTVRPKRGRGRKRFDLTEKKVEECLHLLSFGWFSFGELVKYLGISKTTFYEWMKRNPDIEHQFTQARMNQKAGMMSKMAEIALDGNFQALKWRLAVCHGMVEKQTVIHETDPLQNKVGNMTPDEVEKRYQDLLKKTQTKEKLDGESA